VLVKGRWMDPLRHVKLPLLKYLLESGERRVRVADEGKASHTVFRLLARWERFSLLEAELRTGRTHQIRVHWRISDSRSSATRSTAISRLNGRFRSKG
jgi:23S rRNA pseudouridine955/2504/2580 synthase